MSGSAVQRGLLRTLDFLLVEWLELGSLLQRPRFADHSVETCGELLAMASQLAEEVFEPANRVSDTEEPRIGPDGGVVLPAATHRAWEAFRSAGIAGAGHDHADGGLQLPRTVDMAVRAVLSAAGPNLVPMLLTEGNAALLAEHGSPAQRRAFAVPQVEGRWTGTMALSESQAGSSLADVATRAVPDGTGSADDPLGPRYRITGDKMWISGAEHPLTDNIVHLVLAKVPDDDGTVPTGTGALSLFVVPKVRVGPDGELGERNGVHLVGLNHKLGMRGIPNTALSFDAAVGHLVGAPGQGLAQMFHMMNAARAEIGLLAAALGYAGFAVSLDYARTRRQGRPRGVRDGEQVPLVAHTDVVRMLLAQKSYAEGALALALYVGRLLDDQRTGDDGARARAATLLEVLTPVLKSWPSEWCLEGNSLAIQVLGGAGYTRDFPVEQFWRDQRLNMIHEGTHGIQAMDLLGRKVRLRDGACLRELGAVLSATATRARSAGLGEWAADLERSWGDVLSATDAVWRDDDASAALANATPYLQAFGHVVLAWVHLDLAVAAAGSDHPEAGGRTAAAAYFFAYELPRVAAWLAPVAAGELLCRDLDPALL
ncbi:acyl-CoA dehydrogenase [Klenkia brasiliensis]|uniref:acyl-CoA dehydrogenase n=1 Tax=Klenkia brasiliensis TaxID=333142 RepID=UPI001F5FFF89|nr:acyl-CoA dehydrogenase [Klenkia brasiliensis]